MIPQKLKEFNWGYKPSKGYDTANEVYVKYGKEYRIDDYVNEYKDGTNAKEIINKASGLQNLPHAMEKIKDSEIVIDMNEDIFTINRKLKLGEIAQRKIEAIKAKQAEIAAEQAKITAEKATQQATTNKGE